jgi:hypothetical protein
MPLRLPECRVLEAGLHFLLAFCIMAAIESGKEMNL